MQALPSPQSQEGDVGSLDLATLVADELVRQKPKGRSSTLINLAVIGIGMLASRYGYEVDHDFLAQIIGLAFAMSGAAGVVWGRARAEHPITRKGAERMRTRVEQAVRSAQVRVGSGSTGDLDADGVVRTRPYAQLPAQAGGGVGGNPPDDLGPFVFGD